MALIYLVRHGATTAGEVLVGRAPGIGMSELGNEQIKHNVEYLSNIKFDEIYSSPIERTRVMAEAIAANHNKKVIYSDDLLEVDFGEWTNKLFKELEGDYRWKNFHTNRSGTKVPGGEHILEVQHRMVNIIYEVFNSNPEGTFCLVSHGDPIRTAIAYFTGIHLENMLKLMVSLGSISIIKLTEWNSSLEKLNLTL